MSNINPQRLISPFLVFFFFNFGLTAAWASVLRQFWTSGPETIRFLIVIAIFGSLGALSYRFYFHSYDFHVKEQSQPLYIPVSFIILLAASFVINSSYVSTPSFDLSIFVTLVVSGSVTVILSIAAIRSKPAM